jgi:RNA polymerase sigma-70 factor (ECF subfamily)
MSMVLATQFDPEQAVVEAIRSGDRAAFAGFVRRNGRWVRGVIFGVLGDPPGADRVDDLAQHVWQKVWSRIGELRDITQWRPWVYRLARNTALDAGRRRSRQKCVAQDAAGVPEPATHATPDGQLMSRETRDAVLQAVRALPAKYREPFVLRHVEDWSYRQIAETMNLAPATVETRLVRARRLLREALGGQL